MLNILETNQVILHYIFTETIASLVSDLEVCKANVVKVQNESVKDNFSDDSDEEELEKIEEEPEKDSDYEAETESDSDESTSGDEEPKEMK